MKVTLRCTSLCTGLLPWHEGVLIRAEPISAAFGTQAALPLRVIFHTRSHCKAEGNIGLHYTMRWYAAVAMA